MEAFGGVTLPQLRARPRPAQQFILSLAGPVAGLLLGGLALALEQVLPPEQGSITALVLALFQMVSVNWAIFNLLPILPLDGGQMTLAFLEGVRKRPSVALASWVSVGAGIAVAGLLTWRMGPQPLMLVWLALFALQNFQRARAASAHDGSHRAPEALQEDALERADVASAMEDTRAAVQRRDFESALAAAGASKGRAGPSGKPPRCACGQASSWRAGTTSPPPCSPARASRSGRARMRRWSPRAPTCARAPRIARATGSAAPWKQVLLPRRSARIRSSARSPEHPHFLSMGLAHISIQLYSLKI